MKSKHFSNVSRYSSVYVINSIRQPAPQELDKIHVLYARKFCSRLRLNLCWLIWHIAIGFTAFLRFLTDMRCCENTKWVRKKRKFGTVVNITLTQKYGNYEKRENIKTW